MTVVRVAVIGAGLIGKTHIELVHRSAQCQLAAIVDPQPEASTLAQQYSVPHCHSLDELLQHDTAKPDGVILATPNQLHFDQACACVTANLPVLIEKPVTETIDQAQQLVQLVEQHQAKVLVGHHRMHSSIMQQARTLIDSGVIGDLVAIQGAAMFYKPDPYFVAGPWRTRTGGGPVLINLIHEIGNLRYLCGEIASVQAIASNRQRGFEVEDTVGILLAFESGAVGTFLLSDTAASSKSWEQTAKENLDYFHDDTENCYHIAGTRGSLSVPTMTINHFDKEQAASWYTPMQKTRQPVPIANPLERQLDHFCDLIRGEAQPLVSVTDGYRNLRVTDEIAKVCQSQL